MNWDFFSFLHFSHLDAKNEMTYYVPACLRPPPEGQEGHDKGICSDASDGTFYFNFFDYLPGTSKDDSFLVIRTLDKLSMSVFK